MKLVSVNAGKVQTQPWRDGTKTALLKTPITGLVEVTESGIEGDQQADLQNHGGADKAVLVIPADNYPFFQIEQEFGFLGENLTVKGLTEQQVCLGDRLQIGNVLLEVSQPRSPCWKLSEQGRKVKAWQKQNLLDAYAKSGQVGFYCRVLSAGKLSAGMSINWLTRNEKDVKSFPKITIKELFLAAQYGEDDKALSLLQQALKHPALSVAWQESIKHKLAKA